MRVYTYHLKPGETPLADAVAVREGFCWWAVVFGFLWALSHRLWLVAVVLAAAPMLVRMAIDGGWIDPGIGSTVLIVFSFYVGCSGNDWRREKLERKGWLLAGIVTGRDDAEADQRFFDRVGAGMSASPSPPPPPSPSPSPSPPPSPPPPPPPRLGAAPAR